MLNPIPFLYRYLTVAEHLLVIAVPEVLKSWEEM